MAQVALITGCATGIGRALCEILHCAELADGQPAFKVYATDRSLESMKALSVQGIATLILDVTIAQSIEAAVATVMDQEGHIDLLVCNAGLAATGWLTEMATEEVEKVFNVNVFGMQRCVKAVAPGMMKRRCGRIAVMCSVCSYGVIGFNSIYSATKASLAMMTEALRMELRPFDIEVISIIPGAVHTGILLHEDRSRHYQSKTYGHIMDKVYAVFNQDDENAVPAESAAADIAKGLSAKRAPRIIYTGGKVKLYMLRAFLQQWACPVIAANFTAKFLGLCKEYFWSAKASPPTKTDRCK